MNTTIDTNNTPNLTSNTKAICKLGLDVHAGSIMVARQVEGLRPQPPQKFNVAKFLEWIKDQVQKNQVFSCYEAGPTGYWLHRELEKLGVTNYVVCPTRLDSRGKGVNTDKTDATELLVRLDRYVAGNKKAFSVVTVPTPEQEQKRALSRQRDQLRRKRLSFAAQGRMLLLSQGYRYSNNWWKADCWKKLQEKVPGWITEQMKIFRRIIQCVEKEANALAKRLANTWRTAYVLRMSKSRKTRGQADPVPAAENADSTLRRFNCWCPKVIAIIGQVPDTIADRSIVVPMCRKLVSERRAPLSELNTTGLKAKCTRFAQDMRQTVAQCEKIYGEGLNDRAADTFDPLYVIARLAGAEWERKLQAAAAALVSNSQPQSPRCELLLDILSIFILSGRERLFSSQLAATLRDGGCGMRSFALKYSAIDEHRICQMLRPYGIRPSTIRIGKEVNKGYRRDDLRDALHRYVPNADREAWIEEIARRADLQIEANKEVRQEESRNARNDESFMAELFEKMKKG